MIFRFGVSDKQLFFNSVKGTNLSTTFISLASKSFQAPCTSVASFDQSTLDNSEFNASGKYLDQFLPTDILGGAKYNSNMINL